MVYIRTSRGNVFLSGNVFGLSVGATEVLITRGFRVRWLLEQHFDDHNQDFNAANEEAYEALADAFLGGPLGATVIDCKRVQLDQARVRYDFVSQEFGVLDISDYILTYFKPNPAEHGHPTNRAYFEWQKRRRK